MATMEHERPKCFETPGVEGDRGARVRRLQLAEETQANLDYEIEMLRKTMRTFMRSVRSRKTEAYPEKLSKSLDLLGLTCSRLASVMRVNIALHLNDQNQWVHGFNAQMQALLAEWENGDEQK